MLERILASLQSIEQSRDVRVLYCCESGSRAWGFPSKDSDYDARFLYSHRPEWYFSIDVEHRRDVIEQRITDSLDLNGWDLRKALILLRKSNPPLLEWLQSPIVYFDQYSVADTLRSLLPNYYSPTACLFHYLHMARGNFRDYRHGEVVWVKKYFYVLRPLLAIRWIERGLGVVPTEFGKLVASVVDDSELRRAIEDLLNKKIAGDELDRGPRIPSISEFIERELSRLESTVFPPQKSRLDAERLNQVFRDIVARVWN